MRLKNGNLNMTQGVPWKIILLFSVPIIFGNILQEFYALIDSLIVSRFIGLNAVAAIGGTSPVRMMFTRICMDCSMAFGIAAAHRVGEGNNDALKRVVAVGTSFGFGLSIIILLLTVPNLDFILSMLKIADTIYDDAKLYFTFSVAQLPLCIAYNMSCAFLRAAGNSRAPFYAILFSSILNIILDLLLVVVFPLGILGAAMATFMAQLASALITFLVVFRREPYRTMPVHWRNNHNIIIETSKLWIPMFANSICISVGMLIAHRPINAAGALTAAGIEVGGQIYTVLEASEKAIANGIGVFVGQNIGAKHYKRVRTGMRHMTIVCLILAVTMYFSLMVFGDWMIMCFINKQQTPEEISVAFHAARLFIDVLAWGVFIMYPMHFFRAAIQAMGHTVYPMIGAFFQAVARWATVTFLPPYLGLLALCLPDNAAALACLPIVLFPYLYYIKKLERSAEIEVVN